MSAATSLRLKIGGDTEFLPYSCFLQSRKIVILNRLFARPVWRFSELECAVPGISQRMPSQQLRLLEKCELVRYASTADSTVTRGFFGRGGSTSPDGDSRSAGSISGCATNANVSAGAGPNGGAPLSRASPSFEPQLLGLGPLPGSGALAKVVSVYLAADPLGAVAPTAGAVLRKLAAGGVAGKDGKQHRAPTSSG